MPSKVQLSTEQDEVNAATGARLAGARPGLMTTDISWLLVRALADFATRAAAVPVGTGVLESATIAVVWLVPPPATPVRWTAVAGGVQSDATEALPPQ